ncbi:Actin cortical patch SUR7/pH-response regulator PalI [Ophiocordyceps sinensis CO18]|uniref:Actin cortical patch SUR7/pH-response regulator PalI n=1 Tax=Ophiocordyceps sinensis (strain Co18 / CGMCC 3.14243) TaxID=911162 RepID=T5AQ64_OPHSC|nr:Actin cortical patch SUR7/pH-response regulator PalI [Ophiocordyceps sinensis CO18]
MAGLLGRFGSVLFRVSLLIPLVLSLISGILVSVTLSSGSSPGNLEDLAMFKLDLSRINVARGLQPENTTTVARRDVMISERSLFDASLGGLAISPPVEAASPPVEANPPPSGGVSSPAALGKGVASTITGLLNATVSGQSGDLRQAVGKALTDGSVAGLGGLVQPLIQSVAEEIQSGLGIPQWISLHPRTVCHGNFTNPNDPSSAVKVRSCTQPGKRPSGLGELLGLDGPLQDIAARVTLPKVLNESEKLLLDGVNVLGNLLTALFVLAALFSFFAVLANVVALIAPRNGIVVALNTVLAAAAAALVTGTFVGLIIVITVLVNTLNVFVESFEVVAQLGTQFLGIGIAATLLSLGAAGIWGIVFAAHFWKAAVRLFKDVFAKREVQTEMEAVTAEKTFMI